MKKLLLYPFSLLYGLVVFIRNRLYDLQILQSQEFDIPIISVGNITVGGTGKTPHIEYLTDILKDRFEVAVLSRGYKRKTKGFMLVENTSTVTDVGDEPLQIKQKYPEITVAVCENRVKGVEKLLSEKRIPDVILLDDAFQHRRIQPGLNILLIDYNRPLTNDNLLPSGRMREGLMQMRRANIIIYTKCPSEVTPIMRNIIKKDVMLKPYQELYFTSFGYGNLIPVFQEGTPEDIGSSENAQTALALTGIASPGYFHNWLKKNGLDIIPLIFPDHHSYTNTDIQTIIRTFEQINSEKKIIATTEKDAVRLRESTFIGQEIKKYFWYVPVKVIFLDEEVKQFNKRITGYVGENKGNRELYKRKDKSAT